MSELNSVSDLRVLLSREAIAKRVAEMGAEITRDFKGQSIIRAMETDRSPRKTQPAMRRGIRWAKCA
jgi:hypothetical protein